MDILRAKGPNADYLRDMLAEGKLSITPSVYLLKTGVTKFLEKATSHDIVAHNRLQDLSDERRPFLA